MTSIDGVGGLPDARGERDEWALRLAFLVSTTGDWIYRFALPLLVLRLTRSATSTAMTYVLEFVPYVLIGLVAGNVADRAYRRRVLIVCDLSSAVVVGAMAVTAAAGVQSVPVIYAVALVLASIRPFSFPAFQGFIVERVRPQRRAGVNAWVQATDSTLSMLGPVVGVGVVVWVGAAAACAINAVSFLISAALIARTAHRPPGRHWLAGVWGNVRGDVRDGLKVLVGFGPLLWGTLLMTGTNFAVMSIEANLPYLVAGPQEQSTAGLAAVFAAQGVGALLGAALAPRLLRSVAPGHLLAAGMALLTVALGLPAIKFTLAVLIPAWVLAGLATSLIVVPWFTWRQGVVAADAIGRVTSVSRAFSYLTMPAGAWVGSVLVASGDRRTVFVVAAVAQGLICFGTVASPLLRAGRVGVHS